MQAIQNEEAEVELAIAHVLQAESEAQDAVTRCKAECAELIAEAHRQAGDIAARAERRSARLRERMGAAVEKRILEIGRPVEPEPVEKAVDDTGRERLERAAAAMARELIGAAR